VNPAAAVTLAAGNGDGLPGSPADRAGGDVDEGAEDGALDLSHLAAAVALAATNGRGAGLGATASARGTHLWTGDLDLSLAPENRCFKREAEVVAEVGSTAGAHPPRGAETKASQASEELFENLEGVAEPKIEADTARPGVAEPIVGGATPGVGKDLVGLVDLLEASLGVGLVGDVGMIFAGHLAVGPLDLIGGGRLFHPQHLVVVPLRAHRLPPGCEVSSR
jgi:hypothetical protein